MMYYFILIALAHSMLVGVESIQVDFRGDWGRGSSIQISADGSALYNEYKYIDGEWTIARTIKYVATVEVYNRIIMKLHNSKMYEAKDNTLSEIVTKYMDDHNKYIIIIDAGTEKLTYYKSASLVSQKMIAAKPTREHLGECKELNDFVAICDAMYFTRP